MKGCSSAEISGAYGEEASSGRTVVIHGASRLTVNAVAEGMGISSPVARGETFFSMGYGVVPARNAA